MRAPAIAEFMTKAPQCIQSHERIIDAYRLMRETKCRHLPVLKDGKLVGLVSLRGLYRLETMVDIDRAQEPVVDAMDEVFAVAPGTPVVKVAAEMASLKVGAAVVARDGHVLGIFTTNDALEALVTVLELATADEGRRATAVSRIANESEGKHSP